MIELLSQPETYIAFTTLLLLEIVLGVDNVIFISILSGKLPKEQQKLAFRNGLLLAVVSRLALLFGISAVMRLQTVLFTAAGHGFTGQDLILLTGGLFLIWKAVKEIHEKLEGKEHGHEVGAKTVTLRSVLIQVLILDVVFSIDSVITAVGMVKHIEIMVAAILVSVAIMLAIAGKIGAFVEAHPTVKILALSFLVLIGVNLVAEGTGQHIPKGYTYFAMAFSVMVELLNIQMSKKSKAQPVKLHNVPTAPEVKP